MRRQLFTISDATEDQHSGRGARIVLRIPNQNDFNVEEYIIYDPSQRTSIIRSSLSRPSRSTTDGSSRSRSNQEETSNLMPPSYESLSNSNNTNTANAVDDISESPPDYESAINIENSRNQWGNNKCNKSQIIQLTITFYIKRTFLRSAAHCFFIVVRFFWVNTWQHFFAEPVAECIYKIKKYFCRYMYRSSDVGLYF